MEEREKDYRVTLEGVVALAFPDDWTSDKENSPRLRRNVGSEDINSLIDSIRLNVDSIDCTVHFSGGLRRYSVPLNRYRRNDGDTISRYVIEGSSKGEMSFKVELEDVRHEPILHTDRDVMDSPRSGRYWDRNRIIPKVKYCVEVSSNEEGLDRNDLAESLKSAIKRFYEPKKTEEEIEEIKRVAEAIEKSRLEKREPRSGGFKIQ